MAEIDPSNIVGRRTRGKKIDYAKEAALAGKELEDDEDDDEEYVLFKNNLLELILFQGCSSRNQISRSSDQLRRLWKLAYVDNLKSCYKSVC